MRASGLPVSVDAATDLGEIPADVEASAYRIVQESLTNVLRHAGSQASARVAISRDRGRLLIEIADTGHGAPAGSNGRGIEGMRTRAVGLGGTLDAGPIPGGGFEVRANLPVGDTA
jgi:signal transduction histidine kinase